jgi:plasmid stabilization system protein ParE
MQVRRAARAASDFDAIFEYIAQDNESAAIRQALLILSATRQLEQFPKSGRP